MVLDHPKGVSTHGHEGFVWMLKDEHSKADIIYPQGILPENILLGVTCSLTGLWCPESPGVAAGGLSLSCVSSSMPPHFE